MHARSGCRERLPFLGFGEDAGAAVVEQDDMKFCGPSPGDTPVQTS